MVGVAGRSKACHTCKQRRIACDAKRPECSQCLKSQRVCAGYQKKAIFVNSNSALLCSDIKSAHEWPETKKASDASRRQIVQVYLLKAANDEAGKKDAVNVASDAGALLSLQTTQYRAQLLSTFLTTWLPKDASSLVGLNLWLTCLPDHPSSSQSLDTSIAAVCLAGLGHAHNHDQLILKSKELYASGLGQLQRNLWDQKTMYSDETLASCMALTFYELIECPGRDLGGYNSHQSGLARLVKLRGPKAHTKGMAHNMFLAFRVQTTLQAIKEGKPTFLSSSPWTDTPWDIIPKSPLDQILDFLTQAPHIYLEAAKLQNLSPQALLTNTLDLLDKCWKLHDGIETFFAGFESTIPGPLYEPYLSQDNNPADDPFLGKVFPVAFRFRSLGLASITMWYWAIKFMLFNGMVNHFYPIIDQLKAHSSIARTDCGYCDSCLQAQSVCLTRRRVNKLRSLNEYEDHWSLAWNICQSFEYCIQMMGVGPVAVTAPLSIVAEILGSHPEKGREGRWVRASLKRVEKKGLKFLGHTGITEDPGKLVQV